MLLFLLNSITWPRILLGLLMLLTVRPPARAQVYYLDVSQQAISVPGRMMYVEQVVDGRAGQPAIGMLYKGLHDKPAAVLFQQSMANELTAWLRKQLPQRPTDQGVVLCVRQLRVAETVESTPLTSNTTAKADLAADVYVHLPDGYHFVRSLADHTSSAGIWANSDHAVHLAQLFQRCLAQLTAADWAASATRPVRTLAQLAASRPTAAFAPVLRAAVPRGGVYHTVEQFIANQPDTTLQLRLDTVQWSAVRASILDPNAPARIMSGTGYSRPVWNTPSGWKGTIQLKAKARTANGDRVAAREVWGFSDGQQAYLRQGNTFRMLVRQANFYTYVGAAPVDLAAANRRLWGGGPGSLTTRPAAGAMRRDAEDSSGEPMVFALDMRTGQAAPFPPSGQPQRADTAFVYVYRPPGGPPEPQRLLLNDRQVGQLLPGQYLELVCPHYGDAVRLSLDTASGPTLLVVPNATSTNYVKLRSGNALSPWQWMPVRQGEAEVDALEKRGK